MRPNSSERRREKLPMLFSHMAHILASIWYIEKYLSCLISGIVNISILVRSWTWWEREYTFMDFWFQWGKMIWPVIYNNKWKTFYLMWVTPLSTRQLKVVFWSAKYTQQQTTQSHTSKSTYKYYYTGIENLKKVWLQLAGMCCQVCQKPFEELASAAQLSSWTLLRIRKLYLRYRWPYYIHWKEGHTWRALRSGSISYKLKAVFPATHLSKDLEIKAGRSHYGVWL